MSSGSLMEKLTFDSYHLPQILLLWTLARRYTMPSACCNPRVSQTQLSSILIAHTHIGQPPSTTCGYIVRVVHYSVTPAGHLLLKIICCFHFWDITAHFDGLVRFRYYGFSRYHSVGSVQVASFVYLSLTYHDVKAPL